jgi:DNA-binding transcriptional LysR family regulator
LHALAHKAIVNPNDLSNECLIISEEGGGYRSMFLSILHEYKIIPGTVMELSSVGAIKECTACGLGYTILPKIAVQDELDRGKLTEINWNGPHLKVKTQLIYHRKKWISPAIQAFLKLCEHMGEN